MLCFPLPSSLCPPPLAAWMGVYEEGSFSPVGPYLYICLVTNVSVSDVRSTHGACSSGIDDSISSCFATPCPPPRLIRSSPIDCLRLLGAAHLLPRLPPRPAAPAPSAQGRLHQEHHILYILAGRPGSASRGPAHHPASLRWGRLLSCDLSALQSVSHTMRYVQARAMTTGALQPLCR